MPDPSRITGSEAETAQAFADTCRTLRARISLLLALPVAGLDRIALQARLRDLAEAT